MARYVPPRQGALGQIFDVIVLMVLSVGALYMPLLLGLAGSSKVPKPVDAPTWESLGQTPLMVERWNQLGYADPAAAADMITARFDYSVSPLQVVVMAVVIIGYFVLVLRFSEKEYREVISEKFDAD